MHRTIVLALILLTGLARAELKLASPFSDHMVLQRNLELPVWGWATAGATVEVAFAGAGYTATAGADGTWQVKLAAMPASAESRTLTVRSGEEQVVLEDVLVGDVWICSGQSNMQWPLANSINSGEEVAAADYPLIRLFTVPNSTATEPQALCKGDWRPCTPATARGFSAVGYFFGRDLHRDLGIPIGLINTSWGGTIAEAWTSAPALRANLPEFTGALDSLLEDQKKIDAAKITYTERMQAFQNGLKTIYDREDDLTIADGFAPPTVADSDWPVMVLPANWEERGHPNLDGIVWFRKTIEIPAEWAGKPIVLRPGPIDEVDQTWFNGQPVGKAGNMRQRDTSFWNVPREYKVPGELVKAGPNVIAIRVFDAAGQGGLWGAPGESMKVELDGETATALPLAGEWRYKIEYELPQRPSNPDSPNRPTVLFNAMIAPLIPYAITGAIWYQGESNAGRAEQYRTLLPTMINDWRSRWGVGDFTFLIVQLANFRDRGDTPRDTAWAQLREAQAMTAASLPKTGLALAIDIGDSKDIHPRNKQEVGRRLALAARAIAHGEDIPYSGPVFRDMRADGNALVLTFDHANGGLKAADETLDGFAIAGADGNFVWASAVIDGDTVKLTAEGIAQPVAVRYAWDNDPAADLYNGAGLPAVPFRATLPTEQ